MRAKKNVSADRNQRPKRLKQGDKKKTRSNWIHEHRLTHSKTWSGCYTT